MPTALDGAVTVGVMSTAFVTCMVWKVPGETTPHTAALLYRYMYMIKVSQT